MSHFVVLVIGDDYEKQLAPYHEFECTGEDNEYIQEIDETEKFRKEYETETVSRLRAPDGSLHSPYDDRFYRYPTAEEAKAIGPIAGSGGNGHMSWSSKDWGDGKGYQTKVKFLPNGWKEVRVPVKEAMSFYEYVTDWNGKKPTTYATLDLSKEHKYGYVLVEGTEILKIVDRTNPAAKWDWYSVGGRWTGYLKMKPGKNGLTGRPGVMTERAPKGTADQALKGDVDFTAMRNEKVKEAAQRYDRAINLIAGREIPIWERIREAHNGDIEAAREEYSSYPVIQNWRKDRELMWHEIDEFNAPRQDYLTQAYNGAISTFAVVKDGKWYERGEMGWWACVSNEKDRDEWNAQFNALLDGLPDDTLLTIVDCHI